MRHGLRAVTPRQEWLAARRELLVREKDTLAAGVLLRTALVAWQLRPARNRQAGKPASIHS
jgi:predicted dithiol-disulfide oxidoreductase (DUF899 family)